MPLKTLKMPSMAFLLSFSKQLSLLMKNAIAAVSTLW